MQERIFTLKAGTEVAKQFDGVTIPFRVPSTLQECVAAAGSESNLVAVFNQAHALNVQKSVKAESAEEGATVESLRKHAAEFKYGQVRVRGAATGSAKPSAAKVTQALGDDFLAMLTPEQRAVYDAKMAALKPAPKADESAPTPAPAPTAAPKAGKK